MRLLAIAAAISSVMGAGHSTDISCSALQDVYLDNQCCDGEKSINPDKVLTEVCPTKYQEIDTRVGILWTFKRPANVTYATQEGLLQAVSAMQKQFPGMLFSHSFKNIGCGELCPTLYTYEEFANLDMVKAYISQWASDKAGFQGFISVLEIIGADLFANSAMLPEAKTFVQNLEQTVFKPWHEEVGLVHHPVTFKEFDVNMLPWTKGCGNAQMTCAQTKNSWYENECCGNEDRAVSNVCTPGVRPIGHEIFVHMKFKRAPNTTYATELATRQVASQLRSMFDGYVEGSVVRFPGCYDLCPGSQVTYRFQDKATLLSYFGVYAASEDAFKNFLRVNNQLEYTIAGSPEDMVEIRDQFMTWHETSFNPWYADINHPIPKMHFYETVETTSHTKLCY